MTAVINFHSLYNVNSISMVYITLKLIKAGTGCAATNTKTKYT